MDRDWADLQARCRREAEQKKIIPSRCTYCEKSIQWRRRTPPVCENCEPRHQAEIDSLEKAVAFYRRKEIEKKRGDLK